MKVLFVSAILPFPLYSGGQVRIYNLLKKLSKTHDITLLSFIRTPEEKKYIKELSFCRSVLTIKRGHAWQIQYVARALTSSYPLLLSTYDNQEMRQAIQKELSQGAYDLIHLEPGYVWPALPETRLPIVVSEHNIEDHIYSAYVAQSWFRFPLWADVYKLMRWESTIWTRARRVTAIFDGDRKEMTTRGIDPAKISIVANGVDLPSFPFRPKSTFQLDDLTFLYVGNFSWIQNRDAVSFLLREIWPEIIKKYPHAKLRIVGKNIPHELRQAATASSTTFAEHVGVIQDELTRADIMLAPIRVGGGTKYKLLESMAMGLPVITTRKGAEGLAVTSGTHIMVADNPGEMVRAVGVFAQEKKRLAMVQAARRVIESLYSWESIAKHLAATWKDAYGKKH